MQVDADFLDAYQLPYDYDFIEVLELTNYDDMDYVMDSVNDLEKRYLLKGIEVEKFVRFFVNPDSTLNLMDNVPDEVPLEYYKDCLIKGKDDVAENIMDYGYGGFTKQIIVLATKSN